MDDSFNTWEDKVKKVLPESIDFVKKEMEPLLNAQITEQSVLNDSVNNIEPEVNLFDGFSNFNEEFTSEVNSNTKNKVRVLTRSNNMPGMMSSYSQSNDFNSYDNYANYTSDDFGNINKNGYSETLLLICTAVIVVLIFLVSFMFLNYIR